MRKSRQSLLPVLVAGSLFLALPIVAAQQALAEGGAPQVGIQEKLGAKVDLDAPLRDEQGTQVTLKQLVDKPTILTLNYFSCAGICTPLLNGVLQAANELPLKPGKDFQIVTLSFDPKDTPEIALRKRENYLRQMTRQFPPTAWRFLTGKAEDTKRVTDSVGFMFQAKGKDYLHPGAIILLSPEGKVTRYMYGTSFLPTDLQMAIAEAKKGQVRPTISRILQFCFSYDPVSQRYVFNITRVAGAGVLLLVGVFVVFVLLKGKAKGKDGDKTGTEETTRLPS